MKLNGDFRWGWGRKLLWASLMPLTMVGAGALLAVAIGAVPPSGSAAGTGEAVARLDQPDLVASEASCEVPATPASLTILLVRKDGGAAVLLLEVGPVPNATVRIARWRDRRGRDVACSAPDQDLGVDHRASAADAKARWTS